MIKWFCSGVALGLGLFAACAIADKLDRRHYDDGEVLGIG